jgi:hypothetical protein
MLLFPYRPSLLERVPLGIVGASCFAATALRTYPVEILYHMYAHLPIPFAEYFLQLPFRATRKM